MIARSRNNSPSLLIGLVLLAWLSGIFCPCAAASQTNSNVVAGTGAKRVEPIAVELAFRKALGTLKGHVNLLDRVVDYRVSRADSETWHIRMTGSRDVPGRELLLIVKDSGIVEFKLPRTNANAAAWLSSAKASAPDPEVKSRPEVAFRLGLQALDKWHGMSADSFLTVQGRIHLSRFAEDQWFMDVFGYSGPPMGGWWINIKDNGEVNVTSGF